MHCKDFVVIGPVFEMREYILPTKKVGGRRPQQPHEGGVELVAVRPGSYLHMKEGNNIHL